MIGEQQTDEETPPNRLYASQRAEAIRFHLARGMSRRALEAIYTRSVVQQVIDGA